MSADDRRIISYCFFDQMTDLYEKFEEEYGVDNNKLPSHVYRETALSVN